MCLYPRLIRNPKYSANKKNKGIIPELKDKRVLAVPVGCGNCMECRKKKSREWQVRLTEEIRENTNGKFITFSFSDESLSELKALIEPKNYYEDCNAIATKAVRRFLERWRKKYKKSCRHWIVTELGGQTDRIHLHGIMFTNESTETISEIWKYGHVYVGDYVNEKTVNYIVKYIYKTDEKHKGYKTKILTSAGIGSGYLKRPDAARNKYKTSKTNEVYRTRTGLKLGMPKYYRNHIYNDDEREKLWLEKLDEQVRWVDGKKIDVSKGNENYMILLEEARKKNKKFGYGTREDWTIEEYLKSREELLSAEGAR